MDEQFRSQGATTMQLAHVLKRGGFARLVLLLLSTCVASRSAIVYAQRPAISPGAGGKLVYERDDRGNRIPDFSNCGYAGADQSVPDVPVSVTIAPGDGDETARIQAAIDHVSKLPIGKDGFRGAVLLAPGTFEIAGQLRISASGVVLRGSGAGDGGTTLIATGTDRRTLVRIEGVADRRPHGATTFRVSDDYVPVGARKLRLEPGSKLKVGQQIIVTRPSTIEWIKTLGMNAFGIGWKPGSRDIRWDRIITGLDGDTITLDAPITTAIESRYGGATVASFACPARIRNVGVEDLLLQSAYNTDRPHDEDHAWHGVTMQHVQNAWIRRVEFRHFSGGAVSLWEGTKWITVEDCISLAPISELGGYRRHTFFTQGQLSLFLRCWSENGRHDFAVGHCTPGPNAFVSCYAADAHADSGPIESWASGVLYDNVRISGAALNLKNRWISPPGAGWSAANCLLWQCQAATMHVERPPSANNWAIGPWAGLSGDGTFQAASDFVKPISLYHGQLRERRGEAAAAHVEPGLVDPIGSTNPTLAEAAKFVEASRVPAPELIDLIRERIRQATERARTEYEVQSTEVKDRVSPAPNNQYPTSKSLSIRNGWLIADGRLLTGGLQQQGFWRGNIRPDEAPQFGSAITRFVPGRVGTGFTDDFAHVADKMQDNHVAAFDHHYGLWYDRRRDDHTMVRQQDGNVAPPFYEQPFARTGRGQAWNGLSKYDLTKFNPWYWQRLRDFANLCDDRGLVLIHENYFQHNILEAGAHWADSPWRPANNVNDTGLPEPPPYIGDKRIFMAAQFYDVSDPRRRALHRGYIRQCLDNFADRSNVIQMTSAEYSGPLEFTQFWLDTIIEWEREHNRDVLVALSAPKNVQDAILSDPARSPHVDIIDIRYWSYTANDGLYAPEGGKNLAPRQHLRQTPLKPGGTAAIVKAVREYRSRYPEKAVTYYADMNCPSGRDGAAVLIGGGSLPNVKLPEKLARVVSKMHPTDRVDSAPGQWCLSDDADNYLIYCDSKKDTVEFDLPGGSDEWRVSAIDTATGHIEPGGKVAGNGSFKPNSNLIWLQRIASEKP